MTDTTTVCSQCGAPASDEAPDARRPCPVCGSTARTISVSFNMGIKVDTYLKTKSLHREGGHKVVREETVGDDFFKSTGRWSLMHRLIDRVHDWYEETFRDRETGEILHHKAHPLSEHRGYGSAKNVKSDKLKGR